MRRYYFGFSVSPVAYNRSLKFLFIWRLLTIRVRSFLFLWGFTSVTVCRPSLMERLRFRLFISYRQCIITPYQRALIWFPSFYFLSPRRACPSLEFSVLTDTYSRSLKFSVFTARILLRSLKFPPVAYLLPCRRKNRVAPKSDTPPSKPPRKT